jgi:hypothetical protein
MTLMGKLTPFLATHGSELWRYLRKNLARRATDPRIICMSSTAASTLVPRLRPI